MTEAEDDPKTAWSSVYCHRPYHPWEVMGQRNPRFRRATDGRLLDFKDQEGDGIKNGVADFHEVLAKLDLPKGMILVVMPGHEAAASNGGRPLAFAVQKLVEGDDRFVDGTDVLLRGKSVPKRATSNERAINSHVASLKVKPPQLRGATVVVLDDTASTGNSMDGARQVLLKAGAKRVAGVALGRTVKYL